MNYEQGYRAVMGSWRTTKNLVVLAQRWDGLAKACEGTSRWRKAKTLAVAFNVFLKPLCEKCGRHHDLGDEQFCGS